MIALDSLIAAGVVIGAAFYLYRKFARTRKTGGCGCASGGGSCSGQSRGVEAAPCHTSKQ